MAARHPNDPEEEPKTLRGSHRKEHFKGRDSVPYTGIDQGCLARSYKPSGGSLWRLLQCRLVPSPYPSKTSYPPASVGPQPFAPPLALLAWPAWSRFARARLEPMVGRGTWKTHFKTLPRSSPPSCLPVETCPPSAPGAADI